MTTFVDRKEKGKKAGVAKLDLMSASFLDNSLAVEDSTNISIIAADKSIFRLVSATPAAFSSETLNELRATLMHPGSRVTLELTIGVKPVQYIITRNKKTINII